jgi:hypothetical protein
MVAERSPYLSYRHDKFGVMSVYRTGGRANDSRPLTYLL